MVLVGWIRGNHARPEAMLSGTHHARSLGFQIDKLGVNEGDSVLVGHGLGIQIKHCHERWYLVLVGSPVCYGRHGFASVPRCGLKSMCVVCVVNRCGR